MPDVIPLLKHNPSAQQPEVLEAITVQRGPLIADLVDAALDAEGGLRHHLLVGPRGSGKSHVATLVAYRIRQAGRDDVVLAQLVEDPWAIRNYGKLVAGIVASVAEALDDERLAEEAATLRAEAVGDASRGEQVLREALGDRRLVLLVENLGEVFTRIGDEGQQSFRALAENWRQMLIIATNPQLFEGVSEHPQPFYGFFRITHLDELSLASAAELLRKVADLRADEALLEFLSSGIALPRLRAVEALAGGHPRVWLLLAECVSVVAIDDLVPLFLEALDELTPYYQDRLRELGHQQQEIVMLLSESGGALTNRDLANSSGLKQNVVASRMAELAEKGYVRRVVVPDELASGDQRMTHWELREPLMRLCLDVKQSRGKPLRIIVEFLRAWYGIRLLDELAQLPPEAPLAMEYATAAFRAIGLASATRELIYGTPEEIVRRAEAARRVSPDHVPFAVTKVTGLLRAGRVVEARELVEDIIAKAPGKKKLAARLELQLAVAGEGLAGAPSADDALSHFEQLMREQPDPKGLATLANAWEMRGEDGVAIPIWQRAMKSDPEDPGLQISYAAILVRVGRVDEAIAQLQETVAAHPDASDAHYLLSLRLVAAGRFADALEPAQRAVELMPGDARVQAQLSVTYQSLGYPEHGLEPARAAVALAPENHRYRGILGTMLLMLGETEEGLALLESIVAAEPDDSDSMHEFGFALNAVGRYQEAIPVLERAVALEPESSTGWSALGRALLSVERWQAAAEAFSRSIVFAPDDARGWSDRGWALWRGGHGEEATAALERSVALGGSVTAGARLAVVHAGRGRPQQALVLLERLAEDGYDNEWTSYNRVIILQALGRFDEAERMVHEALARNGDDADLRNALAQGLRQRHAFQDAEDQVQQAIALDDVNPIYRFTFADIALTRGDVAEAVARLRVALEIWSRATDGPPGNTEMLCLIILTAVGESGWKAAVEAVVGVYAAAGAAAALGTGVVQSISTVRSDDVPQAAAEMWLDAWRSAAEHTEELSIAVSMLGAAVRWKADRDRAHLLALPAEQREILTVLLLGEAANAPR
jgi:tetratricopeptide (TPR) repeat protein